MPEGIYRIFRIFQSRLAAGSLGRAMPFIILCVFAEGLSFEWLLGIESIRRPCNIEGSPKKVCEKASGCAPLGLHCTFRTAQEHFLSRRFLGNDKIKDKLGNLFIVFYLLLF